MQAKDKKEKNTEKSKWLLKAMKYCARYESTLRMVDNKMLAWGVFPDERKKILEVLLEKNFINEARYAQAFVNDKMRLKAWGRQKIYAHLKAKGVSENIANTALDSADSKLFYANAQRAAEKKMAALKNKSTPAEVRVKVFRHLLQKGYTHEIALQVSKKVIQKS